MLLRQLDLFFFYKNVLRFFIVQQYSLFLNVHNIPLLRKIIVFFSIFNIIDFDDVRALIIVILLVFFLDVLLFFLKHLLFFI
jgi:hypothetical protein